LGEIGQNSVAKLADAHIVPVTTRQQPSEKSLDEKTSVKIVTPKQCYLGDSPTYKDIFDFMDFGIEANIFLQKCGSKMEPTKLELAAVVSSEPARLLGAMQGHEKYLNLLMSLAVDLPLLKKDKVLFKQMKTSRFLLGSIDIPGTKDKPKSKKSESLLDDQGSDQDDIEDSPIKQWQLASPSEIVVVSNLPPMKALVP